MLDFNTYKTSLISTGANLAQVRRNQSDMIMNSTFTGDPTYKRCLILTPDGWEWVDAKYQKHTTPSILKDEVDYYLQFRPGVHFKLGTYVIVPDDTSPEINTPKDPFDQDYENRTQWWLIVGRTDANQFVRYSILKCNFDFQWIYDGEIRHCYGCVRNANSYTSGIYTNDVSTTLDNLNSAWLPDIKYTYGKNYEKFGLDDIQSIDLGMRFMISDNTIHPKTYSVSKVTELVPVGVVKLSLKQVAFDEKRDNIPLRICDYYDENGDSLVNPPSRVISDPSDTITQFTKIHWCTMNDDGELIRADDIPDFNKNLRINKTSYFDVETSDNYVGRFIWDISIDGEYSSVKKDMLKDYIKLVNFDDGSCSVKPSRSNDLFGVNFILNVMDEDGGHQQRIEMEVIA